MTTLPPISIARSFWQSALLLGGLLLSCFFTAAPAFSQQHFTDCATRTENSATIIIPDTVEISLDGQRIEEGSELAVFNDEGLCAGTMTWTGESATLTIWGAGDFVPASDGLRPGERMHFRLWEASSQTEYTEARDSFYVSFSDQGPHLTEENQYVPNAIYLITALQISTSSRISR